VIKDTSKIEIVKWKLRENLDSMLYIVNDETSGGPIFSITLHVESQTSPNIK
jgi:hypothetical protein